MPTNKITTSKFDSAIPTNDTMFFGYDLIASKNSSTTISYADMYTNIKDYINANYQLDKLLDVPKLCATTVSVQTKSNTIKYSKLPNLEISANEQYDNATTIYDLAGNTNDNMLELQTNSQLLSSYATDDYAILSSISGVATQDKFGTLRIGYIPINQQTYAISIDEDTNQAFVKLSTEDDLVDCMQYIDMLSTKTLLSNYHWTEDLSTEVSCISANVSKYVKQANTITDKYYQMFRKVNAFIFEVNGMYYSKPINFKLHNTALLTTQFDLAYKEIYGNPYELSNIPSYGNFIAAIGTDRIASKAYSDGMTSKTISISSVIIANKDTYVSSVTFNDIDIYDYKKGIIPDIEELQMSVDYIKHSINDISDTLCVNYQALFNKTINDVKTELTSICDKLYPIATYLKTGTEITNLNENIAVGKWSKVEDMCGDSVNVWKRTS